MLGAAFHAGGFRPLLGSSVGGTAGSVRPAAELLGVAVAAAHSGAVTDWAALARELGFSDQAHLTRVFAQVVGTPPASYQLSRRWWWHPR